MCMYCERRTDVKFGWEQPKLPYHSDNLNEGRLNGNVLENENGTVLFMIIKPLLQN